MLSSNRSLLLATAFGLSLSATTVMACEVFTGTASQHVSAGRAYSESECTGFLFGSTCYFGSWINTYFATGSDANLGTNGSASISLSETSPGFFEVGELCGPSGPACSFTEFQEFQSTPSEENPVIAYTAQASGVVIDPDNQAWGAQVRIIDMPEGFDPIWSNWTNTLYESNSKVFHAHFLGGPTLPKGSYTYECRPILEGGETYGSISQYTVTVEDHAPQCIGTATYVLTRDYDKRAIWYAAINGHDQDGDQYTLQSKLSETGYNWRDAEDLFIITATPLTTQPGELSLGQNYMVQSRVLDQNGQPGIACNDHVFLAEDKGAPWVELDSETPYELEILVGSTYDPLENILLKDDYDASGELSVIVEENPVDTSVEGSYTVFYRVTDTAGNEGTPAITVNVVNETSGPACWTETLGNHFAAGRVANVSYVCKTVGGLDNAPTSWGQCSYHIQYGGNPVLSIAETSPGFFETVPSCN